jgi:CheY-like chemotaxis protein
LDILINEYKDILSNKKVLIVDDLLLNRLLLCNIVFNWNMVPLACSSAEEAMIYINHPNAHLQFDIAFIDICMPKINGYELATKISNKIPTLPLIGISSIGDKLDEKFSHLFKFYLSKPIKEHKLFKICLNVFKIGEMQPSNTTIGIKQCCDKLKNCNVLIAEDIYLNQKVIEKTLQKLGFKNIDIVGNGKLALENITRKNMILFFWILRCQFLLESWKQP